MRASLPSLSLLIASLTCAALAACDRPEVIGVVAPGGDESEAPPPPADNGDDDDDITPPPDDELPPPDDDPPPPPPDDPPPPVDEGDAVADALVAAGVAVDVAELASRAYANARAQLITERTILSVIDFSLRSTEQRLWIIDAESGALLVNDRVSHGSGSNSDSDPAVADTFSNTPGSLQSSIGLSLTAETYQGSNGYSLRLDGLEDSNDNMRDRAIVMHGADYAEDAFVESNGYLGRSSGCPAVAMSRSAAIIDIVKEGTLLFSYYPDADWIAASPFLQE